MNFTCILGPLLIYGRILYFYRQCSGVLFLAFLSIARWNFMTNSAVTWDVKDKITFFEVCITELICFLSHVSIKTLNENSIPFKISEADNLRSNKISVLYCYQILSYLWNWTYWSSKQIFSTRFSKSTVIVYLTSKIF